jgi:hypothetical protein
MNSEIVFAMSEYEKLLSPQLKRLHPTCLYLIRIGSPYHPLLNFPMFERLDQLSFESMHSDG